MNTNKSQLLCNRIEMTKYNVKIISKIRAGEYTLNNPKKKKINEMN